MKYLKEVIKVIMILVYVILLVEIHLVINVICESGESIYSELNFF